MPFIRFTSLTAMTESGDAGSGWIYTGTSAAAVAGTPSSQLAPNTVGGIETSLTVGAGSTPIVGLYTAATGGWNADIQLIAYPLGVTWNVNDAAFNVLGTLAYVAGDRIRVGYSDTGNTYLVQVARAADPSTWITVATGTLARSGAAPLHSRLSMIDAAGSVFTAPATINTGSGTVSGNMASLSLSPATGYASGPPELEDSGVIGWITRMPARGSAVWQLEPGATWLQHYYMDTPPPSGGEASGDLASLSLTPATGSFAKYARGSFDDLSLTAATGATAKYARGSFDDISLTPASGATAKYARGNLDDVSLTPATGFAQRVGLGAGSFDAIDLVPATGDGKRVGVGAGSFAPLTLVPATGDASGESTGVSGDFAPISLTPATGRAYTSFKVNLASISLVPATGYASGPIVVLPTPTGLSTNPIKRESLQRSSATRLHARGRR